MNKSCWLSTKPFHCAFCGLKIWCVITYNSGWFWSRRPTEGSISQPKWNKALFNHSYTYRQCRITMASLKVVHHNISIPFISINNIMQGCVKNGGMVGSLASNQIAQKSKHRLWYDPVSRLSFHVSWPNMESGFQCGKPLKVRILHSVLHTEKHLLCLFHLQACC